MISFVGTIAICTWAALWTAAVLLILKFFGLIKKNGKPESPSSQYNILYVFQIFEIEKIYNMKICFLGPNLPESVQNSEEYYIEALPYPIDERIENKGGRSSLHYLCKSSSCNIRQISNHAKNKSSLRRDFHQLK